ncbi:hypothetical protein [Streptomyces niger]|uniref:hypothetical protein n=1 Tax=Streptomyces niger TaxID=66373 RepID=UPI00069A9B9C|nr:hypothetical protein [Streptomyces niger]
MSAAASVRRRLSAVLLAGAALLGTAGAGQLALAPSAAAAPVAAAEDPTPSTDASASASASADPEDAPPPTEAGTSFRTATVIRPGQQATAPASTGDYLYWQFPADAGQGARVDATVDLPGADARHGDATWQLDVYDGLRRRQPCRYGTQTRTAAADAATVELSCTLRTVRANAEPWSNDPLPGAYYVRLTAVRTASADAGLPVKAAVTATTTDAGSAQDVDGSLAAPLVQGSAARPEPDGGWSSGWWSARWLWTAAGAVLAALAGIAGYAATRGRGRPSQLPPAV